MFSRLFSRATEKKFLVADVESGSIALAVVSVPVKGAVIVEAAGRTPIQLDDASDKQSLSSAIQALPQVAEHVLSTYTERKGAKATPPGEGYFLLHAPWARAFGARVEGNLGTEKTIHEDMIRSLSREALKHMEGLDQSRFFEASVLRVDVNGYPTKKPEGKKGSLLSVTALGADADPEARATTLSALTSAFPGRTWKERSAVRAYTTLIADRLGNRRDYLLVDIGSGSTDITAVRKSGLTDHTVVPEGLRTILKRVTPTNGLPEQTLSLLSMLVSDHCDEEACAPLRDALGRADSELARVFGEAFASLSKGRRLPNALVLAAHPAIAPWFEQFFTRVDFGQFTVTTDLFAVERITPEHVTEQVIFAEPKESDTGIALAAAFIQLQEQST